jgi:membrane protease YdiL (CAAX protease family)
MEKLFKIAIGFAVIYSSLELTAHLTGDPMITVNSLLICAVVLIVSVTIERTLFNMNFGKAIKQLGFGKPAFLSIGLSVGLSLMLFACYPLITYLTGYSFTIPPGFVWTAVGLFALHGIAEEILYRGFLFHRLREGRSFLGAGWLTVMFFSLSHIPIIVTQGILVGGMAVLLSIASSFPFALLFEKGKNTIWGPALLHFSIDTIIPVLAAGEFDENSQKAVMLWMAISAVLPYSLFLVYRKRK